MTAYGSCSYEYTRNGELTRRVDSATGSTTDYDYDEFGNLRRVELADGRVITYHVDGLNRRVGKSLDGVRQWGLLYANQLEPVAELDADGHVVSSFIYADRPHVPSLMLKGGQTYRIVADHLGSVRLVVDIATGAIAQRMSYDEYGNVVEDTNPGFQPFGYAGGLYDRDTGLVRFGARDYDALTGRWTAKDPIRFGDGVNLYHYVAGQPINRVDIDGKRTIVIVNNASWYALGDHAGLFVDNGGSQLLYDPGGSYLPPGTPMSNTNLFYDEEARLSHYIEFQMTDGGEVAAYIFETTPEQEAEISSRMEDAHIVSPLMCTVSVRNALRGTGPFADLGSGSRPDGLGSDLDKLCEPSTCSKVVFRK